MQIDRDALNKLLSLNDRQLKAVIGKIAAESGIDLSQFSINTKDIESIRTALSSATDEDLAKASREYETYKRQQNGR